MNTILFESIKKYILHNDTSKPDYFIKINYKFYNDDDDDDDQTKEYRFYPRGGFKYLNVYSYNINDKKYNEKIIENDEELISFIDTIDNNDILTIELWSVRLHAICRTTEGNQFIWIKDGIGLPLGSKNGDDNNLYSYPRYLRCYN